MIQRFLYICCISFIGLNTPCLAQASHNNSTQDSLINHPKKDNFFHRFYRYFEEANDVKEEKKFDFSIIGGPHFSSDTKLGLGLVASGLYRLDRNDKSISPSNVSIYGDITTTGFWLLGIRGNTIFPKDKFRLDANLYFFSFPSSYWGIGYEPARNDSHSTQYKRLEYQIKFDLLWRISSHLYIGPNILFNHVNGKDFDDISFLNGEDHKISNFGPGIVVSYDSRDFIPNPSKGIYIKLEQQFFPDFLGNNHDFNRTSMEIRYFQKLWQGAILASEIQGIFNYGNTPWSMVARLGGSYRMRGYYEGRYRDNDMIQVQTELRQKIYNRHGIAAWIGAGNVFPDTDQFKWKQTLPTYGFGYRWEFKNRINVRLDYGIGKGETAFYFNINEAF